MDYIESNKQEVFLVDDEEWLLKREKEWKKVRSSLIKIPGFPRNLLDCHKEFFFHGSVSNVPKFTCPWLGVELLFKLWYWPVEGEENSSIIVSDYIESLARSRENFLYRWLPTNFKSRFGMMGGKERYVVNALLPNLDFEEVIGVITINNKEVKGMHPTLILWACICHTNELLSGWKMNPHAPGQYLWPHLDYTFKHYNKYLLNYKQWPFFQGKLRLICRQVLDFEQISNDTSFSSNVKTLRNELFKNFESGKYCDTLLFYWNEQKIEFEKGNPYPEEPGFDNE